MGEFVGAMQNRKVSDSKFEVHIKLTRTFLNGFSFILSDLEASCKKALVNGLIFARY